MEGLGWGELIWRGLMEGIGWGELIWKGGSGNSVLYI